MASGGLKSTLTHSKCDLYSGFEFQSRKTCSMLSWKSMRLGNQSGRVKYGESISKCKDGCGHGLQFNRLNRSHDLDAFFSLQRTFAKCSGHLQSWCEDKEFSVSFVLKMNCPKRNEARKRLHSFALKATASSGTCAGTPYAVGNKGFNTGSLRSYDNEMETCFYILNQSPRRANAITVAATADSDQTFPSQDEGEERAVGCGRGEERVIPRKPSPEVEPDEVVQGQLKALRERDIATVFEFASPKNKAHTGPLSRFTEMIQGRAYNVMLGHASAEILSTLSIGPGRFQQRILIKGSSGNQAVFSWSLSKQEDGPFQGCWMIDSVHRDQ